MPQAAFLLLCFPFCCQERSRSLDFEIGLGTRKGSAGQDGVGPNRPCRAVSWRLHKFRMRKGFILQETENWVWDIVSFVLLSLSLPDKRFAHRPSSTEKLKGSWNVLHGCSPSFRLKNQWYAVKRLFPNKYAHKNKYLPADCTLMKVVDSENWLWVSDILQVAFVGMHSQDAAWGFCHRIGKMEKHLTYGKEIEETPFNSYKLTVSVPNSGSSGGCSEGTVLFPKLGMGEPLRTRGSTGHLLSWDAGEGSLNDLYCDNTTSNIFFFKWLSSGKENP